MSEETVPVKTKEETRAASKQIQAKALVNRLGLQRAIVAVRAARKLEAARSTADRAATFSLVEVEDLLALNKVHVAADELAAVVKVLVAEVLG